MGKGVDEARKLDPVSPGPDIIEGFKEQLLIVFLKRLQKYGDNLVFTVEEVDATHQDMLYMECDGQAFKFELRKKN